MAKEIPHSPFEAAGRLWGAFSSPPGSLGVLSMSVSGKVVDEGMRVEYGTPEAVKGFALQAYRPASLPVKKPTPMDENSLSCNSSADLNDQLTALLPELRWPDEEEGAISIVGSPRLQRTDVPLTTFLPPRDVTAQQAQRYSLDGRIQGRNEGVSIELCGRSASAPGCLNSLRIDELWAALPLHPAVNPFDNVPDTDGLFN